MFAPELGGPYLLKAAAFFALVMAVALSRARVTHPYPRLGPGNMVTAARGALVALLAGLIGEPGGGTAAAATVVASVAASLDGLDGWLARRSRMESRFGARFDMEVDALLIVVLAVLAWQYGKAGPWVILSGLMRYLFVAAAAVWPWLGAPLPPSVRRKAVCVIQIVALIVVIGPPVAPPLSRIIAAGGLAVLAWSFLTDVRWLWRQQPG